ncbi:MULTISPECIES: hypothetical protein [Streptomyces]|uniref:hypothetical protein n=1 Tax=Streptomyces TaxID=1883 RepID=UPI001E2C7578|nr:MULTISPECIES: hypothetical protein [Streptomyces]UFQ18688.1 hypothetical protein J2N69_29010 [Streptomyces huasconensis]WCL88306.1 hypothetical protein PPN52_28980 [Streptomyces sp. JCM 35825]
MRQHFYRQTVGAQADQPLRVLAYSLVPSPRARPDEDWGTLQAEADQLGYAITARLHDVAVPVTTTYLPASSASQGVYTPPWDRPGWREAERQLREGLADGVLVLDRHNISSDDDEYHAVLKHLGEHCRAFLHLVISEEPVAPTWRRPLRWMDRKGWGWRQISAQIALIVAVSVVLVLTFKYT